MWEFCFLSILRVLCCCQLRAHCGGRCPHGTQHHCAREGSWASQLESMHSCCMWHLPRPMYAVFCKLCSLFNSLEEVNFYCSFFHRGEGDLGCAQWMVLEVYIQLCAQGFFLVVTIWWYEDLNPCTEFPLISPPLLQGLLLALDHSCSWPLITLGTGL